MRGHHLPGFGRDGAIEVRGHVAEREAGEVLDLGREVELPQRKRARQAILLGNRALDDQRLEVARAA